MSADQYSKTHIMWSTSESEHSQPRLGFIASLLILQPTPVSPGLPWRLRASNKVSLEF